jgi:hypothetical protein
MPPHMQSEFGDHHVGLHHDCITSPWIKQQRESKYIEKAATLPKNELFLLLEERRQVRFSIVEIIFLEYAPLASQMTESEKDDLWWCEEEVAMAKQCIATLCDTTRSNCARDSSSSYISVLGRVYDQCHEFKSASSSPVDENDLKLLSEWARNSHFRRGLEPLIAESIREHQRKARETLVYAVQVLQKNKKIDVETNAEVIRKCSERMSRGARLFAQSLAQADVESIKPRPKVCHARRQKVRKFVSDYYVEEYICCSQFR